MEFKGGVNPVNLVRELAAAIPEKPTPGPGRNVWPTLR
jgi:hypothetical protein